MMTVEERGLQAVAALEDGLREQGWSLCHPFTGIINFWRYPTESGKYNRLISYGCNGNGLLDIQEADENAQNRRIIALQDPVWARALPLLMQFVAETQP